MQFLSNKHGAIDFEEKYQKMRLTVEDFGRRLEQAKEDMEVLADLCLDFDGYTSDTEEENFIERLAITLQDLATKHKEAYEEAEQIGDSVSSLRK